MAPGGTWIYVRIFAVAQLSVSAMKAFFLRRLQGSCSPGPFWEVAMRKHRWSNILKHHNNSLQFICTWIQLVPVGGFPVEATICGELGWQYLPKRMPCGILKAVSVCPAVSWKQFVHSPAIKQLHEYLIGVYINGRYMSWNKMIRFQMPVLKAFYLKRASPTSTLCVLRTNDGAYLMSSFHNSS